MHAQCLLSPEGHKVCLSWPARCQLDDASVCCEVSVGLVQGCEWH